MDLAPLKDRLIVAASYFVTSTVGTSAYALLLFVLYRHRADYHVKHSFYVLLWSLAVADLGEFLTHYVVAIPLTLFGRPLYGDGALLIGLSNMETVFFHLNHFTTFFIAVNRMCVFVAPTLYDTLFDGERVYGSVATVYVMMVVQVCLSAFSGHHKKFNHAKFIFYYTSPHNGTAIGQTIDGSEALNIAYHAYSTMINYLPMASLGMYVVATVALKVFYLSMSTTNSGGTKAQERRLMVQGLIISVVTQLQISGFRWATEIVSFTERLFNSHMVGSLIMGNLVIVNSAANPFIYFAFNKSIRRHILETVHLKTKMQSTTAVRSVHGAAK